MRCKQCDSNNVIEQHELCFKCASLKGVLTEIKGRSQVGYRLENGYRPVKPHYVPVSGLGWGKLWSQETLKKATQQFGTWCDEFPDYPPPVDRFYLPKNVIKDVEDAAIHLLGAHKLRFSTYPTVTAEDIRVTNALGEPEYPFVPSAYTMSLMGISSRHGIVVVGDEPLENENQDTLLEVVKP